MLFELLSNVIFPNPLFVPYGSVVMMRLTEESLTRPPEEVFDVLEKLGEG